MDLPRCGCIVGLKVCYVFAFLFRKSQGLFDYRGQEDERNISLCQPAFHVCSTVSPADRAVFFLCCFSMRQRYNGKQPPRRPWRPRWRTESLVPIRLRRAAIWSLFLLALGAFIQCIYAMLGQVVFREFGFEVELRSLSLIHISETTRPERLWYAVFCLKK